MKKFLCLILLVFIVTTLVACNIDNTPGVSPYNGNNGDNGYNTNNNLTTDYPANNTNQFNGNNNGIPGTGNEVNDTNVTGRVNTR